MVGKKQVTHFEILQYKRIALQRTEHEDKVKVLPENELIEILASNGLMVKRPILLAGETVLVGFKEEEWENALNSK